MERLRASLMTALKIAAADIEEEAGNDEGDTSVDVNRNPPKMYPENIRENSYQHNSIAPMIQFYSKIPKHEERLLRKIRDLAREKYLEGMRDGLFSHNELTSLYGTFEKFAGPSFHTDESEKFMGFRNYKKMIQSLDPKFQQLMTPPDHHLVFVKLITDDPYMRVSITTLFNYAMRKTWLNQTRITLSMYDDIGEGFIKEPQLENYIKDMIPSLVQLKEMDQEFLPFYLCTASRRFFFFLDTSKASRIKIVDILASGLIDELLDLREEEIRPERNWFSFESACQIYQHYLRLDKNGNGLLSPDEFIYFSLAGVNLTPTFVQCVFQVLLTYEGEMDFRAFLDFVIAVENPKEIQSIKFYFHIMDINSQGYLDAFTLQYFYRDIYQMMECHNTERIPFNDVKDEIFDMVAPEDPLKITIQDLIRSGCGRTLFSIFTDFNGIWAHENRESSFSDSQPNLASSIQI